LLRNAPANSIYLGSYEVLKGVAAEKAGVPVPELPLIYNFCAGGIAGALVVALFGSIPFVELCPAGGMRNRAKRNWKLLAKDGVQMGPLPSHCRLV
jgi:hypothetical protein